MTEYQTHTALVQSLEAEVSRLRAINTELKGIIEAGIKPNNSLAQAARQALGALEELAKWDRIGAFENTDSAITALREALVAAPEPAAPTQDPAAWAITYDGRTPHTLWHEGDGPLLDLEIKRQGGSAQKMALYTTPQPARQPLTDDWIRGMCKESWVFDAAKQWIRIAERAHGSGGEA